MNIYPSTFLYIKQHRITGLKYFGKTTKSEEDMLKYLGSGTYWKNHIKIHGKEHVETIWYRLFDNVADLTEFALSFSLENDIVNSNDWANLIVENGLDGSNIGAKHSEETRAKISESKTGIPFSEDHRNNLKEALKTRDFSYITDEYKAKLAAAGANISEETRAKRSASHKGKIKTPEHLAKIAAANRGKTLSEEHKQKIRDAHARRKNAISTLV